MDCLFLPPGCSARLTACKPLYWLPGDGAGRFLGLGDCSPLLGRPLALILPAEACSAFAVVPPTDKARWLRKALPYALEEHLAEDVEQLHLALGERLADGRHRVLAVRRELLAGWLAQLRERGLTVAAIHLDADLLPREGSQLLAWQGRLLLGGEGETRLACCAKNGSAMLQRCPQPLHAYGELPDEAPPGCSDYRLVDNPYHLLAEGRPAAVNLAQGAFAVRSPGKRRALFKPLLACLALWLAAQLAFDLARGWYLTRQGDARAAASLALYRALFPEDWRIVDLRAQFDDHLRRGARDDGTTGFLGLLERSAAVLGGLPMVTVLQLDYQDSFGELSLQVRALDFAVLEQLRQRFADAGLEARMGSASREEEGVTTRVVIRARP